MLATVIGYVVIYLAGLYLAVLMGMWTASLVAKTDDWVSPIVFGLFIGIGGLIIGLLLLGYSLASITGV